MTTNLEALRSIAFTSSGAGSTSLAPVYARTIGVRDSRSDVELFLPLPIGECEALAAALGSSCSSATIELEAPIDLVARDHPVRVDTTSAEWSRMTLGFDGAAEQESGRSMSMLVEGKMTTQVCVSPPESATQLRVRLATGVSAPVTLPADDGALLRCEDGVRLAFRPLVGEAPTSGLTFRGIGELALAVQGARAEVDVLAGSLSLVDVETVIFDPGQHVAIEGDASSPVALELTRVGDESKATFSAQSVHDAVTDAGSLLPTRWELDAALWTPVTGLLAAISVGLFQLGVKGLGTWWFEGRPSIE